MPRFEVLFPKGIGFRLSPNIDDRAVGVRVAKRGEILEGDVVGDGGWLELNTGEGLFLPLKANDGTVLLQQLPDSDGNKGKFLSWLGDEGVGAASGPAPARPASRPDELAALDAKYDAKNSRRSPPGVRGPPSRGAAATQARSAHPLADFGSKLAATPQARSSHPLGEMVNSHDRTTAYMHEFRDALEGMGIDTRDDRYLGTYAPIGGAVDAVRPGPPDAPPATGNSSGRPSSRTASSRSGSRGGSRPVSSGGIAGRPRRSAGGDVGVAGALSLCGSLVVSRSAAGAAEGRWREGPKNAIVPVKEWTSVKHGQEVVNHCSSGRVVDVSDRNVLCMSVLGEKAVLGSADHGLKEVNIRAGQKLRELFSQRCGHTEWVTTVSHCPDGRIVSGAADSKVCLWNSAGVNCVDLTGHLGSISRVRVDAQGKLAISTSYDRTLAVWDLRSKRAAATCTGHNAPVMDFVWWDHVVASGDRSGVVKLWDTNHAQNTGTLKGHKGHITAMLAVPPDGDGTPTIVSGAQDGHLRIWDLRQKLNTFNMSVHPGGAVNDVGVTVNRDHPLLVSTGADGRVLVLDPRAGYTPMAEFTDVTRDFLYSLLVLDDVAFVGDGRGQVTCFDLTVGQQCYTLNAGQNAIRCLGATAASLVCAGDDGNAIIFDF